MSSPLAIGSLVADKYLVREKIGQGATGEVYLAEQVALGRAVALKVLRPEHGASREMADRMAAEAKLLASVEHEHVVRILDVGRIEEDRAFIVLEYVDGVSLARLVAENGPLPWRWAADAVLQMLSALVALHERHLLHLDIKPANCLNAGHLDPLSQRPRTKLVDFGIAKAVGSQSEGTPTGTPAYWSPEQALGQSVDVRADVYCVGSTFYDLITGKPPNRASLRPPSNANPGAGIPPEIDAVVQRALALDPDQRHQTALELANALRRAVEANAIPDTLVSGGHIAHDTTAPVVLPADGGTEEQQLDALRRKVETFWVTGVLGAAVEPLALARQRRTLELEWVSGIGAELQTGKPLEIAADGSLRDTYLAHGKSLLVVGGPGSGKTTQLLLLARELLRQERKAVAVVYALSGWAQRALPIEEWLVEELNGKYQVPRRLGRAWVEASRIIPLLDGLDDVSFRAQGPVRASHQRLHGRPAIGILRPGGHLPAARVCRERQAAGAGCRRPAAPARSGQRVRVPGPLRRRWRQAADAPRRRARADDEDPARADAPHEPGREGDRQARREPGP